MTKLIIFFAYFSLALFGSTQSVTFQCQYENDWHGNMDKSVYHCIVKNAVSITSPDAAQVDSISGTHLPGFNNDNVTDFSVKQGQIQYFPRGINKFFKNLKGLFIYITGLKEIHQSDLKDFPNILKLGLYNTNSLEILEENLFDFNPNLEMILLLNNKISHIDPNVFDKLTKLKAVDIRSNTCIDIIAWYDSTKVQNFIKTVKSSQCINSEYSSLEQKVKNLKVESKNLKLENLKEKLEKLKNEIKISKYPNFFQQQMEDLKAAQDKKAQEEKVPKVIENTNEKVSIVNKEILSLSNKLTASIKETGTKNSENFDKITKIVENNAKKVEKLESKLSEITTNLKNYASQVINGTNSNKIKNNEQCTAIKEDLRNINGTMAGIKQIVSNLSTTSNSETRNEENYSDLKDTRLEKLEENVENLKLSAQQIKNEVSEGYYGLMGSINIKTDKMEAKIEGIETKMANIEEQNQKFEENLAKIMKALKIDV